MRYNAEIKQEMHVCMSRGKLIKGQALWTVLQNDSDLTAWKAEFK